jgi:peptide/nickel transport system substrate-binding protein
MEAAPPERPQEVPEEAKEVETAPPKKRSRRWLALLVALIIIVAGIIGAWYYLTRPGAGSNVLPVTVASASTSTTFPNTAIQFDATRSWDLNANITTYAWDFGDGTQGTGATTTHSYSVHGHYVVTLHVTDNLGATANNDVYLLYIAVLPQDPLQSTTSPPVAVMYTDGNARPVGTTVAFDATSSWEWTSVNGALVGLNGPALSYSWSFTGTATVDSTSANPTWNFTQPGNYPVKLTVKSSTTGLTDTTINTIRILEPTPAYSGTVPNPGVYTMVIPNEPSYLDPAHDYSWPTFNNLFDNIYEHLITYDRDDVNTLVPILATEIPTTANGGISPDGRNYTFHIRQGVQFQCGGQLTAADVKYSFDRSMTMNLPDGPAWELLQVMNNRSIVVLDQYTVVFHLTRVFAPLLKLLSFGGFGVLSKAYVIANNGWNPSVAGSNLSYDNGANATGWGGRDDPFMDSHMCGTGPYQFSAWQHGQSITIVSFNGYWRKPASIKTVILELATEFNTRLLDLKGGTADSGYFRQDLNQYTSVRALRSSGYWVISGNPSLSETAKLQLNQNINLAQVPATDNVPSNFFQDIHVRLAFNYALNRTAIIQSARAGQAVESRGPLPPIVFGYNASVPTYDINLAKAEQELKLAMAPDNTSWWDKGFTLTAIDIEGFPAYSAMLLNVKDSLESINPRIHINVQDLALSALFSKWVSQGYAVMATTMYPEYADAYTWLGEESYSQAFIAKFMGVPNTLDPLLDKALNATNPIIQAKLYGDIQYQLYQLAWYVWVDYTLALDAAAPWVQGYYYQPLRAAPLFYALSKG